MAEESEDKKTVKIHLPRFGWKHLSTILVVALVASLFFVFKPFNLPIAGMSVALTPQQAAKKAVDYISNNLVQTGQATLVSVEELSGIYNVTTSYQGQQIPVYVTKDGKFLILQQQTFDMSKPIPKQPEQQQQQGQPQQTTIDEEELAKFIDCLKDSDFKIYGANWCGWTKQLVTMLGGFDMVQPIYIECTEQKEECNKAGITGYPTIVIKGERYQGGRAFKAFSDATGCAIPSGAEIEQSNPSSGGC